MAASGSKTVYVTPDNNLVFRWWEKSQSIANNTTTVAWAMEFTSNQWGTISSNVDKAYKVVVNGNTYEGYARHGIGANQTKTLASGETVITHNTDGTKTFSYSFYQTFAGLVYGGVSIGNKSGSGTGTLTKIIKKATITAAPNFTDEGNPTITYSNGAGNAVTSLKACISLDGSADDIAYRNISKTGTSYTFNLTDAERKVLRAATATSNSRTVRFYIQTVIEGETYLHYLSKTLTIVNAAPTINPVVEDIDAGMLAITGNKNLYVKGYSNPKYTINATAKKEATITSYKAVNGSITRTSNVGEFYNIDSNIITVSATDSRGNTVSKEITLTMIPYIRLTCNLVAGTPSTEGALTLTISGNYYNASIGATANALTVQYRLKEESGEYSEWAAATATITNNTYKAEVAITGLDYKSAYTFQARAWDVIQIVESAEKTVKTTPVFDWGFNDFNFNVPVNITDVSNKRLKMNDYTVLRNNADGYTVVSSSDYEGQVFLRPNGSDTGVGQLVINSTGDMTLNGHIYNGANSKAIYGKTTSGTAVQALDACNTSNNCVLGYGFYSGNVGYTNLYGVDVNVFTKNAFNINGRAYGTNKVLWSGAWFMTAGHTATLSEAISKQPHGVILIFSGYASGAAQDYWFSSTFVPKQAIASYPGCGFTFFMLNATFASVGAKYLYINDTTITGNDYNSRTAYTGSGITYNNGNFVLRQVIGV